MPSAMFFPLRSNAKSLVKGAPANSVHERIKLAALLHDTIILEKGAWSGNAGPGGGMQWRYPATQAADLQWQTPRERYQAQSSAFYVAMTPTNAPDDQPARTVLHSPSSIAWRSTFHPIVDTLPEAYDWIEFVYLDDSPAGKRLAGEWIRADRRDDGLEQLIAEPFVRGLVTENANYDVVLSAQLDAAVSMDDLHRQVLRARVARGQAAPVLGARTVEIVYPDISRLDWPDIAALRKHRDIDRLRKTLAEIEAAALETSPSVASVDQTILNTYIKQLHLANEHIEGSFLGNLAVAGLGVVVGELVTYGVLGMPVVGGATGGTVGLAVDQVRGFLRRRQWSTADKAVRQRIAGSKT